MRDIFNKFLMFCMVIGVAVAVIGAGMAYSSGSTTDTTHFTMILVGAFVAMGSFIWFQMRKKNRANRYGY